MRSSSTLRCVPILLACTALGACAASSDRYPSLAIRDAERVQGSFEAPSSEALLPTPASAESLANAESLLQSANDSHRKFLASVAGARSAVANAGSGIESNSWANAQVVLADLDSRRSETAIALGELDLMFTDATLGFTERAEIEAVRAQVIAMVAEEDAVLAQLRGTLSR